MLLEWVTCYMTSNVVSRYCCGNFRLFHETSQTRHQVRLLNRMVFRFTRELWRVEAVSSNLVNNSKGRKANAADRSRPANAKLKMYNSSAIAWQSLATSLQ